MLKIFSAAQQTNRKKSEIFFSVLNLAIPILMGIYIFLNTLPLSAVSEFCFYLSVFALILLLFSRKTSFTLRTPLTLPFALFFLWAVFGLFFTLDFKNTLHDLRGHLLNYLIIFYLLVNYYNSQKKLEILSWIVISSTTIFSIVALIIFYFIEGFPFTYRLGVGAGAGFFFKEMYTSWMCLLTVFAITLTLNNLYRAKSIAVKILMGGCFLILTITTLLNQSRSALVGLLVTLLILSFENKKNLIFIALAFIILISMPGINDRVIQLGLDDVRSKINRLSLEIVKEYPVTGVGFGMEIYGNKYVLDLKKFNKKLAPEHQQETIIRAPHNTFLDIAVRTGIVGLVLFLAILLTAIWMLWQTRRWTKNEYFRSWAIGLFACLMSFLSQALFNDTTYNSRAVAFYTILAMITILWNIVQKEKTTAAELL